MIKNFFQLTMAFILFSYEVNALKIDITRGQIAPTPIAITDFLSKDNLGEETTNVITADLERSGLFAPLSKKVFIQDNLSLKQGPRYADWRLLNAQFLVAGEVEPADKKLVGHFQLYDTFSGRVLIDTKVSVDSRNQWRKLAHKIADQIYERVIGEPGLFDTQIAFVDETGSGNRRRKRLAIMDQDGENVVYLTDGRRLVNTPRFSPDQKTLVYLEFINERATVLMMDLQTQQKQSLSQIRGLSFAPRFSPDGHSVVMSLSKGGSTAIFRMDMLTQRKVQLTNYVDGCIDTSPCYSPDGKQIVFTSDREGNRERIYVMDANGNNVHRISSGEGTYSQPMWSPRGDMIAFTKMMGGQFYIGVMNIDGSNERLIAEAHFVESPCWSSNGRSLIFTVEPQNKSNQSLLWTVDLSGRFLRQVQTPANASDPAWSAKGN